MWFYLESPNRLISSQNGVPGVIGRPEPKLFSIYCEGTGGFEAYFKGQSLYYRVIGPGYNEESPENQKILIGDFLPQNWYYIGIEHEPQRMITKAHVNIVINNDLKRSVNMEYPKINNYTPLTKFSFGENLVGRISSIILFKNCIGQAK